MPRTEDAGWSEAWFHSASWVPAMPRRLASFWWHHRAVAYGLISTVLTGSESQPWAVSTEVASCQGCLTTPEGSMRPIRNALIIQFCVHVDDMAALGLTHHLIVLATGWRRPSEGYLERISGYCP